MSMLVMDTDQEKEKKQSVVNNKSNFQLKII